MGVLLTNRALGRHPSGARSTFEQFAAQVALCVQEFNAARGLELLRCERTHNRLGVYREQQVHVSLELELDELECIVTFKRFEVSRTLRVVSDLRIPVMRSSGAALGEADFRRLAKQALLPMMA